MRIVCFPFTVTRNATDVIVALDFDLIAFLAFSGMFVFVAINDLRHAVIAGTVVDSSFNTF